MRIVLSQPSWGLKLGLGLSLAKDGVVAAIEHVHGTYVKAQVRINVNFNHQL